MSDDGPQRALSPASAPAPGMFRVGISRFLVLCTLPTLLLVSLIGVGVILDLGLIEQLALTTGVEHLKENPGELGFSVPGENGAPEFPPEEDEGAFIGEKAPTLEAMSRIVTETRNARRYIYISGIFLVCGMLFYFLTIRRYILIPIVLIARNLDLLRLSQPPGPIPRVRIRELQRLLDILPGLRQYMEALYAQSDALEEEKDKYINLSMMDGLTGVGNRRSFDEQMTRYGAGSALLMLDVDMFKLYNDTLGHQAGDAALVAVAHAMKSALLRSSDRVFRYGGEEFTVILPDASEEAAMSVAARILITIREMNIPHPASSVAPFLTASIGVSIGKGTETIDQREIIARADKALYRAKRSGRNRICVYTPGDLDPPPLRKNL
jgi:diguanylate cyclase (GGDEF)-like protein